jgi:hypothetical protein
MSRKFQVVTTFHDAGYHAYGKRMIETFLANWPREVGLRVYAENTEIFERAENLQILDISSTIPALAAFKQRWQSVPMATGNQARGPRDRRGKQPGIGFKWDAVRFSHKVYAFCHAARDCDVDILIWMDADTVCHSAMPLSYLESQMPLGTNLGYLGREKKYSECGLYALDLIAPGSREFVDIFQAFYDDAESGIFSLSEWHDSFVFDQVRAIMSRTPCWQELNWSQGLIRGEGHPLINSAWGAYLDHLKGDRKQTGRSRQQDLRVTRTESYWQ